MDIVKTKSGRLAIRIYDENGMKRLLSLRKIAVTGVVAVGLTAAAALAPSIIREIKYNAEMENIQDLRNAADEIKEMGSKAYIEIDGQTVFIPDEINEYATAKRNLIENKDSENIEEYEQKVREEAYDVQKVGEQIVKDELDIDTVKASALEDGIVYTGTSIDEDGNEIKQEIGGSFTANVYGRSDNENKIIEMMPDALETGEGIRLK